jgi:hypothetical protein
MKSLLGLIETVRTGYEQVRRRQAKFKSSIRLKTILCLIEDIFLFQLNQQLKEMVSHNEMLFSVLGNFDATQHFIILQNEIGVLQYEI